MTQVVGAALSLAGGALLGVLVWRLDRERRRREARGPPLAAIALPLLAVFVAIRTVQALGPLNAPLWFGLRNTFFAATWVLALWAVQSGSDVDAGHRRGALILAATAVPSGFLVPFWYSLTTFGLGLGCLGAVCAILAWRTPPGGEPFVRGLALTAAVVAVVAAWVDVLLLLAGFGGDPRMFNVSRWAMDATFIMVALFAFPALRGARAADAAAGAAAETTQP